ncbi:MAG TPA: DivIVA domain-containing protein [Nocardioidaceae bacterium]
MTHEHVFPYFRSAEDIRSQEFAHRMRGLDEYEVREFLDLLADQTSAVEREREEYRAENERLRAEVRELRENPKTQDPDDINPQAVILFSQAQQVADQLVEEAVRHARDLMSSARNQEREILERAHEAADQAVRMSGAVLPDGDVMGYSTPVPEVEYARTFARIAHVQLRSVVDALADAVDKLGEVPKLASGQLARESREDPLPAQAAGGWDAGSSFVYPRPVNG